MYQVGNRVQLHPATDRWMMGDRYGEIVGVVKHSCEVVYRVKLDKSGKTMNFLAKNILEQV